MRRNLVVPVLVPLLVVSHFLLHLGLGIGRAAPDLLTVAVLLAVREVGMGWGAGFGFVMGVLEDSFSALAFGANALALTVVGIVGGRTRDLFVGDSVLFLSAYFFFGKLGKDLIRWTAMRTDVREPFFNVVVMDGGLAALYVAAIGLVLVI